jgi:hypothetical protein
VFGRKKHKAHESDESHERFYLFPGQGGRNYRIKQQRIMCWTVTASLIFGALLTTVLWWMSKSRR